MLNNQATILIVDDDDMNLSIMEEILADDYELLVAHNGKEAVQITSERRPGLVLMDIMMPVMDGYEACRAIKSLPHASLTHVVLVSARATANERVQGYEAGADDYIVKPFDEEELKAKVQVQLRLRNALSELAIAQQELQADNSILNDTVDRQQQDLQDSRDLIVFALARLADSRDPETGEHLERMREYCKLIAANLAVSGPCTDQIDDVFVQRIYQASPLHDIGKVGIPDSILLKPGRLTDREFELMKQHTLIGAEALQEVFQHGRVGGFLEMALRIARSHHERWNGTGYPDQLRGADIPLEARICAVADVFDALTSARVYKKAFTLDVARTMIEEERGEHFDPAVVDAFLACFDSCVDVCERFSASRSASQG